MNARLLEIVKQSGLLNILTEHQNEYAGGGEFDFRAYPEVEKFAELVIAAYTPPPHPIYLASDGRFYEIPQRQKPMTDEEVDTLSRTMVKGGKSVNWLCRAIEKAHGIGGEE